MMTKRAIEETPITDDGAAELTPAEIRNVLFALARRQVDEQAARPAIRALNRIMRDSALAPQRHRPAGRRDLR